MSGSYLIPDLAPGEVHRAEQTIKRSRFIVSIAHAASPEEARAFVERVREEHRGATHCCSAFNAGPPGDTAKIGASDDGEPKGTAGRPMLTALLHCGAGEIAAVVTRYFGGTLLGTGGLVRAYQGSVKLGLETLPLREKEETLRLLVSVDPAMAPAAERFVREAGGCIVKSDFGIDAAYEIELPARAEKTFSEALLGACAGDALIERLGSEP
ncbi:MAG: YigZ family protein [Burkholderia sp.]|jgi:uncharacterized YigZ family protein